MKGLDEYAERRERILKALDQLVEERLVPIGQITLDVVRARASALREGRFYIAVCGQMKAGKSCLLNAMVFRRPVLPMAATVMTAKVTVLEYGAREGFSVEFYSSAEWAKVCDDFLGSPDKERFEADLRAAQEAGASANEWISSAGRRVTFEGYADLLSFVGVPTDGGTRSPYVKSVSLIHTNARYRNVVVADTPGLNDPNKIRENLTLAWVQRADALVYVTYAGQAGLSEADVHFLDKYLLHVPSSSRVMAVNKCDTVDDLDAVKAFIKRLARHERQSVRTVFSGGEPLFVSALGGLIERAMAAGPLDEDLRDAYDLLDKKWLEPRNHRIDELEDVVAQRLLENRGDRLLAGGNEFVRSVMVLHERALGEERARLEDLVRILGSDMPQLEQALIAAMSAEKTVIDAFDEIQDHTREEEIKLTEWAKTELSRIFMAIESRAGEELKIGARSAVGQSSEAAWILKREMESSTREFVEIGVQLRERASLALKALADEVQTICNRFGVDTVSRLRTLVELSLAKSLDSIRGTVDERLNPKAVGRLVVDNTAWYERLFNTKTGRDRAHGMIMSIVQDEIAAAQTRILAEVDAALAKTLSNAAKAIEMAIKTALRGRQEAIRLAKVDHGSKTTKIESARAELKEALTKDARIRVIKDRLNRLMDLGT